MNYGLIAIACSEAQWTGQGHQAATAKVKIVDVRGQVCGIIEPTADGIRIHGQLAVTLTRPGSPAEPVCKIFLMEAEHEIV